MATSPTGSFEPVHGKSRIVIVIAIVVVGMGVLGAAGYLAWSKRRGGSTAESGDVSPDVERWCKIRQEWGQKVDPLAGDIMLKSIKAEDRSEAEKLILQRNKLGNDYGRKIVGLAVPAVSPIAAIEAALMKEGSVRANIAVEIYNLLAKIDSTDESSKMGEMRETLKTGIAQRIQQGKENADRAVNAGLTALGGCRQIYRGPVTDQGMADSPYITWDELEMRRTTAVVKFDEKLKDLEPLEEFTNRVYHELIRAYRPILAGCYKKAKAKNSAMGAKMGLQVRLKKSGEVKTLAVAWVENDKKEESFLDCLLEKASKWKLPRPDPKTRVVVVTIDLSKL